jgi:hypothetical protein
LAEGLFAILLCEALRRPAELDILLCLLLLPARFCLLLRLARAPFLADLCLFAPPALWPDRADLPPPFDFALPAELRLEPCLPEGPAMTTDTVAKLIKIAAKIVKGLHMGISLLTCDEIAAQVDAAQRRSWQFRMVGSQLTDLTGRLENRARNPGVCQLARFSLRKIRFELNGSNRESDAAAKQRPTQEEVRASRRASRDLAKLIRDLDNDAFRLWRELLVATGTILVEHPVRH